MGKERYWTQRSSKRGEGGEADAKNPPGCMCAFFQFFDFHPLHFPIQQQQPSFKFPSDKAEDQSIPKGAEAPRNSLESEDGTLSFISKEEDLKIPKRMQIKTIRIRRAKEGNESDLSSEISNSPCTKTPTLVARLMGLDLLPDAQSPSSSSSCISTPSTQENSRFHRYKQRQNILTKPRKSTDSDIAASRSLPETPRISSARRSDADRRLSLQINKENLGLGEELELPRFSFSKRKFEEQSCRSPSHYARQIVKQVRESVSRKVGLDITNSVKNREQSKEELVVQIRIKKSPKTSLKVIDESSPGKNPSPPSSSPRLRFMEAKQKPTTKPSSPLNPKDQNSQSVKLPSHPPINIQPQNPRVLTRSKPQAFGEEELQNQKSIPKCKKNANERFSARFKNPHQTSAIIRNKQEESFVRPPRSSTPRANDAKSKSKRTSNLLNLTSIPTLRPVKTDPSPPETKIPQKQPQEPDVQQSNRSTQLSRCPRQTYKQEGKWILGTREGNAEEDDKSNGASTAGGACCGPSSEFVYVTNILSRNTEANKGARNRASSLDPSIFHHLEKYYYCPTSVSNVAERNNQLGLPCNRKLLFDLVDEILGEILKSLVKQKSNNHGSDVLASQLIAEAVCKRIRSFPEANCEVLEDIDALIEKEDLGKIMKEGLDCKEEEEEGLVEEIERSILYSLVLEAIDACDGQ
ncbi:hypothetical protein QN277_000105 [Acacia crassicarpa]|uniref:DUF4378 domain-containing protein n=1 Tax=Acacia crassicarpa TaxID=499986 RepID=A0AAE1TGS6_9FABA|nr:hypothetical protein QN277_000105 [Acacia crassicarpa]